MKYIGLCVLRGNPKRVEWLKEKEQILKDVWIEIILAGVKGDKHVYIKIF